MLLLRLSPHRKTVQSYIIAIYKESIANIIGGFNITVGLPWHIADKVYTPVNYNRKFHCVLNVVA